MWCNFIPYLFGGNNTVEYRIHPPSVNYDKILAWLFICNAILQYSHEVKEELRSFEGSLLDYLSTADIDLKKIISTVYPRSTVKDLCMHYINYRTKLRADLDSVGDGTGKEELINPKFEYKFIDSI